MTSGDILDTSLLCYVGDFDTQVYNLLNHVRLTASEVRNLTNIFVDLEQALQVLAPGLQVFPFGSIVTGLGIRTSDVDCFIALPHGMKLNKSHIIHAKNILKRYNRIFANVFAIVNATVPIVKFLHVPTNCNCDINFKSPSGVQNSELVSFLLQMDDSERALQLAVIVKYWSKVHRLTGTNLLVSYGLTLMVIFYLQLLNMLPSVYELQRNVPKCTYMIDNWNTGFDMSVPVKDNDDSLYDLLGGFFKCYASMNFGQNIISPYMGRLLDRQTFKRVNEIPPEFALYKHNISHDMCKPLKLDLPMCIQDPFEHSRNCSSSVHQKFAARLKAHFQYAAKRFDEVPPEDFLRAIFTEVPTVPVTVKKPPKHVFQNKVTKQKHIPPQRNAARNNLNITRCYEMIRNVRKK